MFKKLKRFIYGLFERIFVRRQRRFYIERHIEEPEKIKLFSVYVVGEEGYEWIAVFICPCGCGQIVRLNLLYGDNRPTWRVTHDRRRRVTIRPSVWRKIDCRSHFIIRDGLIIWC
jgi:hypothetical protein